MKITFESGSDDTFRSALERRVAAELDRLEVPFTYELEVVLPGYGQIPYLPDFTIESDASHLELPRWVECKPQQMLYTLRDVTGVTRRAGEYFKQDVTVSGVAASDLLDLGLSELRKPKRLAELSGDDVLVIGDVQRTTSLTALFTEETIVFSRSNAFCNQRGIVLAQEKAEKHARWQQDYELRQAEYLQQQEQRRRHEAQNRWNAVRAVVMQTVTSLPRFASPCLGCQVSDTTGLVYKVRLENSERWLRVCPTCKAGAQS